MPKNTVAIVFATYNNADIAAACLMSCLTQNHDNLLVIAADDGSTDNTCERLIQTAQGDSRFHLIELPHGERGAARAAAIKVAKENNADFLYIIDSDMMLEPGLISSCVRYLEKAPGVGALVIPERPFSKSRNFMSRVKVFEREILNNAGTEVGANSIEAARFWRIDGYMFTGGINANQIAFEETQPTIRFLELGGTIKRATFTGVSHDEKHVTMQNLLAKKRYYFSVMDKTISRSYFFRPVLYRPGNIARYITSPLLSAGLFTMYIVLSFVAALDILRGLKRRPA